MTGTDVAFIRRALAAFEEAVELEEEARQAWLAKQRLSDPHLATEVERLLLADAQALHALPTGGLHAPMTPPPSHIGHYRVLDRIGGGGMGEVFAGARADGLFDHLVAIKRMNPSLMPDAARALFDKERRALARLSHRHIAQLFDGGVDDTGAPYLIMELVRGAPIDRYLADKDAPVREVVEHVAAICDGVQHAHQQLIVHADLKPANILVNEAGDAKIVDFGVARILRDAEAADDGAIYPQTPAYASPQRRAGASPTPADDVFSLGVILKELLTLSPAGGKRESRTSPSETLKQHPPEERSADWVSRRVRECSGDLDAIVERAFAEDLDRRYVSAAALAEDLRAWLQFRPLKVRTGDRAYVLRKFVRRRRLRVFAGAVAATGVLLSLTVVTLLYAQADQARQQAEKRFTEVRSLAKYLLHDVYDQLEQAPRTLAVRHDLTRVAQSYLDQLAQSPSAPPDVKRDVIVSLVRLAELQAGRRSSNLGKPAETRLTLDKADTLLDDLKQQGSWLPEDQQQQISVNLLRAMLSTNADQNLEEAAVYLTSAQEQLAQLPDGAETRRLRVLSFVQAADLANWTSDYAGGIRNADAALAALAQMPDSERVSNEMRDAELRVRTFHGDALYYQQKPQEAAAIYREVIALAVAWLSEQPASMQARRHVIVARWNLGTTLLGEDQAEEALRELNAAAALTPELVAFEPADDNAIRTETILLLSRAQAQVATGDVENGLRTARAQVEKRREQHTANPDVAEYARSYAVTLASLGDLLAETNQIDKACPVFDQANGLFEDLQKRNRVAQFDTSTGGWAMLRDSMKKYCGGR